MEHLTKCQLRKGLTVDGKISDEGLSFFIERPGSFLLILREEEAKHLVRAIELTCKIVDDRRRRF